VVPFLHREEDVYTVAAELQGEKDLTIQTFRPDVPLNPAFSRIKPFSADKMTQIRANVSDIMSTGKIKEQEHPPRLSTVGPEHDQENLYQ
ncbi:MAG: hypothetical protein KA801_18400, partial [Syntrophorhabdaceae bacterium]|nr:hypothetical protein [Syntrophorhabdaceae bacterium]